MKIKKKYSITIAVMLVATIAMFAKVEIQEGWVTIIKWCLISIFAGFSVKKITGAIK